MARRQVVDRTSATDGVRKPVKAGTGTMSANSISSQIANSSPVTVLADLVDLGDQRDDGVLTPWLAGDVAVAARSSRRLVRRTQ